MHARFAGVVIRVLRNRGRIEFDNCGILQSIRFSRLDINTPGAVQEIHEGQRVFFSIHKDPATGKRHASRINVDRNDCRWMDAEPN